MTLHEELLQIRQKGVPLQGICTLVSWEHGDQLDDLLRELDGDMNSTFDSWLFPVHVTNIEGHTKSEQYHSVMDEADVSYNHDYLCERWALLNYLINETE